MLIKKSFFVFLFSLCLVSSSFAGIRNIEKNSSDEEEHGSLKKIDVYDNTKVKHINVEKYYLKASK